MDVETISTDELIEELHRRFPVLLVVGDRDALDPEHDSEFAMYYFGNMTALIGAAVRATRRLNGIDRRENWQDFTPGDKE